MVLNNMEMTTIQNILQHSDKLFAEGKAGQVEEFWQESLRQAIQQKDVSVQITLLNELQGMYRDQSRHEEALSCGRQARALMEEHGLVHTKAYALILLNIANAQRAARHYKEAIKTYEETFSAFAEHYAPADLAYAGLYNNLSLLYQELGEPERALYYQNRALELVQAVPGERIRVATTHVNIAVTLLQTSRWEEAETHLKQALELFEQDEKKDFHYSSALAAWGEFLLRKGHYEQAQTVLENALQELSRNVGKSEAYRKTEQKLQMAKNKGEKTFQKPLVSVREVPNGFGPGMKLAYTFYELSFDEILAPFPDIRQRAAAGLVGAGSECYGFDDTYSMDHDYLPGYNIWLSRQDMETAGAQIQKRYEAAQKEFIEGLPQSLKKQILATFQTPEGSGRKGVCERTDFYYKVLHKKRLPYSEQEWLAVPEWILAELTNGCVFRDGEGVFTGFREHLLAYYPDGAYKKRLAETLIRMGQTGQYNFRRMCRRNDFFTARQMVGAFIQNGLQLVYLLNHVYAPYEKWTFKRAGQLKQLSWMLPALEELQKQCYQVGTSDDFSDLMEKAIEVIAVQIVKELQERGITKMSDAFLAAQGQQILAGLHV